jgi:gluconokinase
MAGRIVVAGVAGVGKSAVAERMASSLGIPFLEGDAVHTDAARAKMRSGRSLTDADRAPWLDEIAAWLAARPAAVASCSALKRAYRDRLRARIPGLYVVLLDADRDVVRARVADRAGHFMPAALVDSQFDALDGLGSDEDGVTLDAAQPLETVFRAALAACCG